MDFTNRLQEILKQDTFKLLLNVTFNIFHNKKIKNFLDLIQNLSTFNSLNTIMKRKKFIIYQKLLVLRNIFCIKDTNMKMKMKIYFYNWKRLLIVNCNNSFERKIFLRKIVNEKITQSDYFSRLMKFSLFNFLKFYKTFSEKNEEKENDNSFDDNNNNNNDKEIPLPINESLITKKSEFFLNENEENIRNKNKIIDIKTISSNSNKDISTIRIIEAIEKISKFSLRFSFEKLKAYSFSIKNELLKFELENMSDKIQEVFKELFYKKKIFANEKKKNFDLLEEVKNYMINKYENVHKKKFLLLYSAFIIKNKIAKKELNKKNLIKYFKIWRGHTDNSQLEKYQILLEEKEIQFHDMKLLKFFSIMKNNIRKKFNFFLAKIEIYSQKKKELEFLANSYIFFENNYNNYLKNVLKGCYRVERIKHKIKKCPINFKEEIDVNFKENEFLVLETSEENREKNKKINFSALEMFKNNNNNLNEKIEGNYQYDTKGKFIENNNNNNNISLENINKNPYCESNNKKYQINSIENYFYLWKAKTIKYSCLIKNFENTLSNKIMNFYDVVNGIFIKRYHDFFTKFSHIFLTYKYNEYKFDACEYYINNLFKKKYYL